MTKRQIENFFKNFKYKQCKFEVKMINQNSFKVISTVPVICVKTGKEKEFSDETVFKTKGLTEQSLLVAVRDWLILASLHEVDENIKYKGKKTFDPHRTKVYLW